MYGNYVIVGSKNGKLYILNKLTSKIIKSFNNPEGCPITPIIADGIMYGYGGNDKWQGHLSA